MGRGRTGWGWVLGGVVLAASPVLAEPADEGDQPAPSVVLLLLDDAGWADVGCYGGLMDTPRIDRLAAEGMRFTDCHSAAPNCSPSRAGLLTGRIPARAGIYSYLPPGHVMHLREEEVTVAELLRGAGYRTGHFGKWHLSDLGDPRQPGPLEHGFETSFGTSNNAAPSHLDPVNFVRDGEAVGKVEGYSCQIVVDEALAWLEGIGAADGPGAVLPFFACVWFHEPHTPIASPPELVAGYRERHPGMGEREASYLANIENVDLAVGRLLDRLDEWGWGEEVVVWYTSDNGPVGASSRGELRGVKSHVWEGGHRVPGIVRWRGQIKAGSECATPVSGIDFLPTVCALTGIEPPRDRPIDGADLVPLLEGRAEDFARATPLYWYFYRMNPSLALRDGEWSLVAWTDDAERPKAHPLLREDMDFVLGSEPVRFELYRLGDDLGQRRDVAAEEPDVFERMVGKLVGLHREVTEGGVRWEIPEGYQSGAARRVWDSE